MSHKCHSILWDDRGIRLGEVASVSADLPDGYAIPEHFHPEDQLVFASAGVMTVRTGQGVWVVPPLRAVWIPAEIPHRINMFGAVSMRTLYFLPELARAIPGKCFVMNVSPLLRELILHACRFKRLSAKITNERHLIEILMDQLQVTGSLPLQLPHPADPRALRVARALLAKPGDARTLATLARNSGASKRTIERLFLEETNMTFGQWRQQLRLLHAMQLLAAGEKVTAAAMDAGYNSASAFIAMFRKQLGTTPAHYLDDATAGEAQ